MSACQLRVVGETRRIISIRIALPYAGFKVTSNPRFNYQAERAYYSKAVTVIGPYWSVDTDMANWISGYPDILCGKTILDIGTGEAWIPMLIAERYKPLRVVGVDLIWHRLLAANSRRDLATMSLVCGDCYRLPHPSNRFDIVLGNGVLHHLPSLNLIAAEVCRVLKPGGTYFGREPNLRNPLVRHMVLGSSHRSMNEYAITAIEVLAAFRSQGMKADVRYFWRRVPWVRHPLLAVSMAFQATLPAV